MNTIEEGWEQNRDEYMRNAYAAFRSEGKPVSLGEVRKKWKILTNDAALHYLWKAIGIYRMNDMLDVSDEGDRRLYDMDRIEDREEIDYDLDTVYADGEKVSMSVQEPFQVYQDVEYQDVESPIVPYFIAREHLERSGYDVFPYEDADMAGVVARDVSQNGQKETWYGFYNHFSDGKDAYWLNQFFRDLETEDGEKLLEQDKIFSPQNRESYADGIWEDEVLKMRQRGFNIWEAAVEAVEESLPRMLEEYKVRYDREASEQQLLERELRLLAGEDVFDEDAENYIEGAAHSLYEGNIRRPSSLLEPFSKQVEATPTDEGDMNYNEATRGSPTSEQKKQRNKAYLSHYFDLVWQFTEAKYGEIETEDTL